MTATTHPVSTPLSSPPARRTGSLLHAAVAAVPARHLRRALPSVAALLLCLWPTLAGGHFLVLIPSADVVEADDPKTVHLSIVFTHPMEGGPVMNLERPRRFAVSVDGKTTDLGEKLQEVRTGDKTAYEALVKVGRPGDYVYYVEPVPYWEPAERKMIVHYTKVVVDVLGAEEGWDNLLGLPVEIEPLVRPYGLWTGNTFRGIVRHNGKPVPFAEVEVEYYNSQGKVRLPNESYSTQVIKADGNGVFSYSMPKAGWWGFAALVDGEKKMANPEGEEVDVELGGLIWVQTRDMTEAGPASR